MRACNCARASPLQSRTRVGCDRCHPVCCRLCDEVSIHAPAWGATSAPQRSRRSRAGFNPRTRVGCDPKMVVKPRDTPLFQSTHPRGVRPLRNGASPSGVAEFQSTHPRGVRHCGKLLARGWIVVSIHAPAWGATDHVGSAGRLGRFQSTHPRGVRPAQPGLQKAVLPVSIHAPTWGATCASRRIPDRSMTFQSTHPRGVRLGAQLVLTQAGFVSIHAPAWGATRFHRHVDILFVVSIHAPAWGATFLIYLSL